MISKKKFGTTVTAFGVAAGMLLSSAAPAHAEETAKTVQETQQGQLFNGYQHKEEQSPK